ncbi:hydrolytic protein [Streptomyces sp. S.PNR 29]|uniref:COG1470 family protein n=1 Tax=Streptomyces sp. S.PNR 29 TaxID=2973805 RepID=UPI0025B10A32|nr:hydrolytic protein [Streptomyces sp. S.PNR 29]MDN0200540.1 hydrolytic protein [Streptomyces sp. S.PNR 29]
MTPSAASSGPGAPDLDIPAVTVAPGGTATTSLTVRNDSDIVEAYSLEVVGDCASWTTVEPPRVSLYPGTSETVTLRLAPPRSPEVRAGEVPLGVRVLPAEHPESVRVLETTVRIEEFHELHTELSPRRRRGWLRGRYRLAVRNQGNTPVQVGFTPGQAGEELGFAFSPAEPKLEPGESVEVGLRVRTGKPVWFGAPVVWPFTVDTAESGDPEETGRDDTAVRAPLDAEFVQIPVFPKWLLAALAVLLALLLAWFTLVRPAVRSAAKEAANEAVQPRPTPPGERGGQTPGTGSGNGSGASPGGQEAGAGTGSGTDGTGTGGGASAGDGSSVGGGQQSSTTIDLETSSGETKTGTYKVPEDSVFGVTDLVAANFQGDEGLLTIAFGDRKITTIALETFRNQDYHWVTPIKIPANDTVTVEVTCAKPGTPATGRQAQGCHEVVNVSGVLSRIKR